MRTTKSVIAVLAFCSAFFLFIGCASTDHHTYTKENTLLYENGELSTHVEKTSTDGKEPVEKTLYLKGNPRSAQQKKKSQQTDDELLSRALESYYEYYNSLTEEARNTDYAFISTEEIQVDSTIDKSYTAYALLGRPLVIAGSTAFSLCKCSVYAVGNVIVGWIFPFQFVMPAQDRKDFSFDFKVVAPSFSKTFERARAAREKARVKDYPEYFHRFTENHMVVQTSKSEITNKTSADEKTVRVIAKDSMEYDNKLSVSASAVADAYTTFSVVDVIGTSITIPIAAACWVGGIALGIPCALFMGACEMLSD
ncbi:MAG: hypothetical protein K6G80_01630 [Treponema sp.]|nr:hypothetical protein [Treponema sp.]